MSEACAEHAPYLVITVSAPGLAPARIESDPGASHYVGIGRLGPPAQPSVILVTEDGGSAGCVQFDAAGPHGTAYRGMAKLKELLQAAGYGVGPEEPSLSARSGG